MRFYWFTFVALLLSDFHWSLDLKPKSRRSTVPNRLLQEILQDKEVLSTPKTSFVEEGDMSIVDTINGSVGKTSGGLLYRRTQVFYAAARVFADYKICQWRCNQMQNADEAVINEIWNQTHERNAKFLGDKFISLEGLWVKLGQYLSSRADVMPDAYLRVLSKCQDSLPPKPFSVIKAQVEHELGGRKLFTVFSRVDEEPLACASIAQVHRAQLSDGRDVVIKVQHAEVARRLLQDLRNLETIGDTLRRFDPDFDFSPVIREWAAEIPKELDFRSEASNMQRVGKNLAPMLPSNYDGTQNLGPTGDLTVDEIIPVDSTTTFSPELEGTESKTEPKTGLDPKANSKDLSIDVSLPVVIDEFVTEKMLVMTFVDGFKV
jgi:aarF domain-containing kinase